MVVLRTHKMVMWMSSVFPWIECGNFFEDLWYWDSMVVLRTHNFFSVDVIISVSMGAIMWEHC